MAVEFTDEEALAARRAIQLIQQLSGNPESRGHLQRSLKVLDPKIETDDDVRERNAKPYVEEIAALRAKFDEREARDAAEREERTNNEALQRLNDGFSRLRTTQGLTPEGEEKLKQIMTEKTIPDPEVAFAYFERQNPKPAAEQPGWTPDRWNYQDDLMPDNKAWITDPEKAADDAIGQILMEERRNARGDN
jgi:hypothetical protein